MKRTFIAFDIPAGDNLKLFYEQIRNSLQSEKINWIPDNNLHITLKFLGDTDEKLLPAIIEDIRAIVSQYSVMKIVLSGLGVFKNIHEPRVLWIGCHADERLSVIASSFHEHLKKYGFEPELRKFSPHLTIGRIKEIHQKNTLADLITANKNTILQEHMIGEIILYESTLTPSGSRYTPIKKIKLRD